MAVVHTYLFVGHPGRRALGEAMTSSSFEMKRQTKGRTGRAGSSDEVSSGSVNMRDRASAQEFVEPGR